MLPYPNIDPTIVRVGPMQIRWYGLMYVLGFIATWLLVRQQIKKYGLRDLGARFEDLNFFLILSLILGGRLGYVLFYNFNYYMRHPLEIPATWQGGMSFHGALIGLLVGGFFYCRRHRLGFLETADVYIVTVPIGIGLGRIGNFINGELFGRITDVPWAMIFPGGGPLPRHPSQLYECLLEGVLLFILLWVLKSKYRQRHWHHGTMLALFLVLYGIFRSFAELFRQPDPQLGFLFAAVTMGQVLSCLMIIGGLFLLFVIKKKQQAIA